MAGVTQACPCGSGKRYRACCQPLHRGGQAGSPEALMRSRFSAFAVGRAKYLVNSTAELGPMWQPDTDAWERSLRAQCAGARFTALRVLAAPPPPDGGPGFVRFEADVVENGEQHTISELSRFTLQRGSWVYHGRATPQEEAALG